MNLVNLELLTLQCRSIRSASDSDGEDDMTTSSPTAGQWQPSTMSREEWYDCHGMNCDDYTRTLNKVLQLKVLAYQQNNTDLSVLDNMDEVIEVL